MTCAKSLIAGLAVTLSAAASADSRPNIVFILADDLGWVDLGCYGSTFYETPNIDRLAAAGMRFTDAYAACPVCSPTRASILTGKYPARLDLTEFIPGNFYPHERLLPGKHMLHLVLEEVTLAESLESVGYATAHIGKWHLGREERHRPEHQGFEYVVDGSAGSPRSYFSPYRNPHLTDGPVGEYLTDRQTDEAIRFIERQDRDRPFFLYLAYNAVHTPVQGKQAYIDKYREKMKTDTSQIDPIYAAMVHSLDDGVGRLMDKLDALNIADRTIVIFFSDNGGYTRYTRNTPLRAGKGQLYEGGIREPLIVRWPGVVKPGSTCDTPVTSVDFYPSLLEIAGAPKRNLQLDGVSLVSLWKSSTRPLDRRAIYWHYPHYYDALDSRPCAAVRSGSYKLIEFYEGPRVELYDLAKDPGESHDLAMHMPDKTAALGRMLHAWQKSVDAQMPKPNPDYDPKRRTQGAQSFFNLHEALR